ncbi:MAG TPA: hypothetical protein VLC92_00350 [Rhodocyclaceae bacterium]|nr:hypothetical protein [Rhodocyclaceae bacterium]
MPGATRTRAGWLDQQDVQRRLKAGEFNAIDVGDVQAREYPDGRLEVLAPEGLRHRDYREIPFNRLCQLASQYPDLVTVLERAGWAVG